MEHAHYILLIHKALTGAISQEEQAELNGWLELDEANQVQMGELVAIWSGDWSAPRTSTPAKSLQRERLLRTLGTVKASENATVRKHYFITASLMAIALIVGTLLIVELDKIVSDRQVAVNFSDDRIEEIGQELEEQYHIDITIVSPQQLSCTFTGSFIGQDVEEVLRTIARSMGFTYTFKNGTYYIKGRCRGTAT